jgi:chromosome segregation ATPase
MADTWDFNDEEELDDDEELDDEEVEEENDEHPANGWEDEDDEVDLDDQPVESLPPATTQPPRVGGLLLGRLSQFLEAVTQPEQPLQPQQLVQPPLLPQQSPAALIRAIVSPAGFEDVSSSNAVLSSSTATAIPYLHEEEVIPESDLVLEGQNGWGDDDLELDHTDEGDDDDDEVVPETAQHAVSVSQPVSYNDLDTKHDNNDDDDDIDEIDENIQDTNLEALEEALEADDDDNAVFQEETPSSPQAIEAMVVESSSQPPPATITSIPFLGWIYDRGTKKQNGSATVSNEFGHEQPLEEQQISVEPQHDSGGWEEDDNVLEEALDEEEEDDDDDDVHVEPTLQFANATAIPHDDDEDNDNLDDIDLNAGDSAPPTGNNPLVSSLQVPLAVEPSPKNIQVGWDDTHHKIDDDEDDDEVLKEISNSGVIVVDHVPLPSERVTFTSATNSAISAATTSSLYEGQDYGLVVDHTPLLEDFSNDYKMDRSVSIRVVVPVGDGVDEDEEYDDDDNANTTLPEKSSQVGTADYFPDAGTSAWDDDDDDELDDALVADQGEGIVDYTPSEHVGRMLYADSTLSVAATSLEDGKQDYGLVVDHTPREMPIRGPPTDASFAAQTDVSMLVLMAEQEYLDQDEEDDGGVTVEGSRIEATIAEEAAENEPTTPAGDGWDDDVLEEEEEALEAGIVDHLPSEPVRVPIATTDIAILTTVSTMSVATTSVCEDEEKDDDNEADFGPVVDHTPKRQLRKYLSLDTGNISAAQSRSVSDNPPSEVVEEEAEEGEDEAANDESGDHGNYLSEENLNDTASGRALSRACAAVSFASSTRGGSSSGGDDENFNLVVDHTPTDEPNLLPVDASVAVLATAEEIEDEEQDDGSAVEDSRFGPVVDHTPSLSPHPASRASSMIVLPTDDDDDDMDVTNTTGDFGGASTLDGWEEPELENLASVSEDGPLLLNAEGQPLQDDPRVVVDHIPRQQARPDSRAAEASTCVLADPSEVLSHLDDCLGQQEEMFGPVVDLTPPSRATVAQSAAGSTAVNAPPSEVPDDLDDENLTEPADGEGWDHETVDEETPNPQSAIDEDASKPREQMVDFLPPEPNDFANNDIVSTMATGGAQSVVQPDDAREDEFGPVVDHTPRSPAAVSASVFSNSSIVAASECERLLQEDVESETATRVSDNTGLQDENVVDHLPPVKFYRRADSTATVPSQVSSEDDNVESGSEEDDEDYVPVVDHLPPKTPFPPSRGGSTIDALATVSEVVEDLSDEEDDDGDANGWNEEDLPDEDLGSSLHTNETPSPTDERIRQKDLAFYRSEAFRSVDHNLNIPPAASSDATVMTSNGGNVDESHYFDHQMGSPHNDLTVFHDATGAENSSHTGGNDTEFYDPETGEASTWDEGVVYDDNQEDEGANNLIIETGQHSDDVADHSVERAMPLHITAQRRDSNEMTPKTGARSLVSVKDTPEIDLGCRACSEAKTADCPCIRQILALNGNNGGMVGVVVTPEGSRVKVDFNKLLQTEITRRLLVEKECEALRSTVESLKLSLGAAQASMSLQALGRRASDDALQDFDNARQRCASMETENEALKLSNVQKDQSISELQSKELEWNSLRESHSMDVRLLKQKIEEVSRDRDEVKVACEGLLAQNTDLRHHLESARIQLLDLSSLRLTLTDTKELESKPLVDALSADIEQLKENVHELTREKSEVTTLCDELSRQNNCLKKDLSAAKDRLSDLDSQHSAALARESTSTAQIQRLKDSLEQLTSASSAESNLQEQLISVQNELASKIGELGELQSQLSEVRRRLQASEGLSFSQTKEIARLSKHHEQEVENLRQQLRNVQTAEQEALSAKEKAENELTSSAKVFEIENQRQKAEIQRLSNEAKDSSLRHRQECYQNSVNIQQKVVESDSLKETLRHLEKEKQELSKRLSELQLGVFQSQLVASELETVRKERNSLQEELKESIFLVESQRKRLDDFESLEAKMSDMGKTHDQERDEILKSAMSSRHETQRLTSELAIVVEEKKSVLLHLDDIQSKYRTLENTIEAMKLSAVKSEAKLRDKNSELESLRCELERVSKECHSLSVDRERLSVRCGDLERASHRPTAVDRSPDISAVSDVLNRQVHEQQLLLCEQTKEIQELQARLSGITDDLAAKDASLVLLQKQNSNIRVRAQEVVNENEALVAKMDELQLELAQRREQIEGFDMEIKEHVENESKLKEDLNLLFSEREMVLRERDTLEEDNEDMLVQFGLLKQEMDSLREQLIAKEQSLKDMESRQQSESTRTVETEPIVANGVHHVAPPDEYRKQADELSGANTRLQERLEALSASIEQKEAQLNSISVENQGLLARLREAEDQLKTSKAQESNMVTLTQRLEERCRNLEKQLNDSTAEVASCKLELQEQGHSFKAKEDSMEIAAHSLEERCRDLEKELSDSRSFSRGNTDIEKQVHVLSCQLSEKDSQLQALAADNSELRRRLQDKNAGKNQATPDAEVIEKEHQVALTRLEDKCVELEKSCGELQVANNRLKEVLRNTQSVAEHRIQQLDHRRHSLEQEKAVDLERITFLEQTCESHEGEIEKKNLTIADLQHRLHQVSQDTGPVVQDLQQSIKRLEFDRHQLTQQIEGLESLLLQTKQELRETRSKLATAESGLLTQNQSNNQDDVDKRLATAESKFKEKSKEATEFKKKAFLLSKQVGSLQIELQTLRERLESLESSPSSTDTDLLIQQVKTLQEQLKAIAAEHRTKDEKLRSEFNALYGAMTKKSEQVADLESQLQSLSSELSVCRESLLAKEEEIRRLTYDMEAQHSKELQSTAATTAQILESTHDDAESLEIMRSHIIALGHDLERSENQRAETLDRLMKERMANAQSLKLLTDNVKRFYWSMSSGDSLAA